MISGGYEGGSRPMAGAPPCMGEKRCRELVKRRAEQRCERCGRLGPTTVHHRKKRSAGGRWDPSNCVALCGHGTAGDHGWAEANPNEAEAEGFHVRPWQIPENIPVIHALYGRVYLLENGEVSEANQGELAAAGGGLSDGVQGSGERVNEDDQPTVPEGPA